MNDRLVEEVENKLFNQMKCQLNNILLNQKKWIILFICLILIVIYCSIFVMLFSLIRNIHSKHEYFDENFKIEKEKLNRIKENLFGLQETASKNLFKDRDCYKCWGSLLQLDYKSIYSYMISINQPIQRSYYKTLDPLQKLLLRLSYVNIYLLMIIYIKPFRLVFFSVLLYLINVCIYAELFLGDKPNVYYTLTIGICIYLFSIFLLFKILMDLLMIVNYQNMKNTSLLNK